MRNFTMMIAVVAICGCGGAEMNRSDQDGTGSNQAALSSSDRAPDGKGMKTRDTAVSPALGASNGINYHGGPVMVGTPNIYFIWYGNWAGNNAPTLLTDWAQHFGATPYYKINTTYYNAANVHLSNAAHFGGSTFVGYTHGKALTDANIQSIVASAIANKKFPKDPNGVYFVLTSQDVDESSGFCTAYCGWHNHGTISGLDVKYSFVGNAARCPSACADQVTSPNGNLGADAMASILSHEFEETTSDPDLTAWYDVNGAENADKCAWTFGAEYKAPNGSLANMHFGGRDWLIQQNWVNANGGFCALHP